MLFFLSLKQLFKGKYESSQKAATMVAIEDIYASLLPSSGFKMDSKTSKYWSNAILKGDKTQSDFSDFVLRSNDYVNYVRSLFVDVYYELAVCISETEDVHSMFEEMMKGKEGALVSRGDIKYFISRTPGFREGLDREVARLYKVHKGTTVSQSDNEAISAPFLDDKDGSYTFEQLEIDISEIRSAVETLSSPASFDPSDIPPPSPASLSSVRNANRNDEEIVQIYETVVQRNMSAREFLLFASDLFVIQDKVARCKKYSKEIDEHLIRVQDIVKRYLEEDLGRDAFISKHLIAAFTIDNYSQVLQDEIVMSTEYRSKMTAKIKQLHDKMYGEDMVDDDCSYLFDRVRERKIEISNEDLNIFIAEFKKETDEIVQRVFDIYMDVYEREPEEDELNGHVTFMRMTTDKMIADSTIKSELRNALEYHDVLKKRIKKVYMTNHSVNPNPPPSLVFKILDKILAFRDRDDIDAVISKYVS
jgi:hypothetical protein